MSAYSNATQALLGQAANGTVSSAIKEASTDWKTLLSAVADTVNAVGTVVHIGLKAYHIWIDVRQLRALHRLAHGDAENGNTALRQHRGENGGVVAPQANEVGNIATVDEGRV